MNDRELTEGSKLTATIPPNAAVLRWLPVVGYIPIFLR